VRPDAETLPALLAHRRGVDGDLDAVVADGRRITYAGLDASSASAAARLVGAGVVAGDRVGLLAPNGVAWAVVAVAVMRVGAVLVPLSTLLRPPELLAQLRTASVSHLVAVPSFRGRAQIEELEQVAPGLRGALDAGSRHAAVPALRRLWATGDLDPTEVGAVVPGAGDLDPTGTGDVGAVGPGAFGPVGVEAPVEAPEAPVEAPVEAPEALVRAMEDRVRPASDMVVLFTSGSTGPPKGVIHTHGAGLRATAAGLGQRCIRRGERLYVPMPLFWTGGLCGGLLSTMLAGATLLTEAEPEPSGTLHLLERERVTLFRGWPDQAARLAAEPAFAEVDLSALGDGSLPPLLPASRRPAPGARANLFGMTESFGPYCGDRLDMDMPPDKHGSCGRPFDGVEVRIVDPQTGAAVPAGEVGEIWLRGPDMMRGICGRLRSEVFTPDGSYRTGDRGRLDADGYLWHAGRLDDMFKVSGATVYPSEVEAALRSLDGVRQAHVTDVPDASGARRVGAVVVTDEPATAVAAGARLVLSAFKVPTLWLLTGEASTVPMTGTGKVDKAALRDLLAAAPDAAAPEDASARGAPET
jgi:acyl-CoA synthetase (AMP-forming)/AMP-acid ligase II